MSDFAPWRMCKRLRHATKKGEEDDAVDAIIDSEYSQDWHEHGELLLTIEEKMPWLE